MRAIAVLFLSMLAISCGKHVSDDSTDHLGEVIFSNESSYRVSIYQSSFEGTLLVDKLESGASYSAMLYPSNNHGFGSVFSIKYWYLLDGEDFWTGGIDPDMQIPLNIEAGNTYLIQIPQPSKLQGNEAFLQVLNASSKPIEFNRLGMHFRQINGEFPVPPGKIGIYKINSSNSGIEFKGYTIFQIIDNYYPIPEFTAKNGYIYNFEFNGTEVMRKEDQTIQL